MNDFIKKALPWIGAAATGNVPALVAMAATQLSGVIGAEVAPTAKAITSAVMGATPDQIQAMQAADQEFAAKMQALGFSHVEELERIAAGDRSSARDREIHTSDHATPRALAAVAVVCFLAMVVEVMRGVAPADGMRDVLMILVGAAIALVKDVYGYYFGSSAGSRDNQAALRDAAKS